MKHIKEYSQFVNEANGIAYPETFANIKEMQEFAQQHGPIRYMYGNSGYAMKPDRFGTGLNKEPLDSFWAMFRYYATQSANMGPDYMAVVKNRFAEESKSLPKFMKKYLQVGYARQMGGYYFYEFKPQWTFEWDHDSSTVTGLEADLLKTASPAIQNEYLQQIERFDPRTHRMMKEFLK
jgi:hypothetical protein